MKINHIIVSTEKVIENKRPMSRAAKGNEKYGKNGMKALAKAGREGASEKKLDAVRNKYDNYNEGWSQKYKSSINCSHPKGFSQKAHCAGKKKHNESIEMEMVCEDCGMCETHGDHSQKSLDEACWKGYHKEGMKTMFGKKYPNCIKNKIASPAVMRKLGMAEQGVAEVSNNALKSYQQKVSSDSMKHKADPTKRSPEKANRSVAGFAKAQNRLEQGVAEGMNNWALKDKHTPTVKLIPRPREMNRWARQDIHNKAYDFPPTHYDKDGKDMYGQKKPESDVAEMHSQEPKGRMKSDGTRSHSTYGSRDHYSDSDPQHTATPTTAKKTTKQATDIFNKAFKDVYKKQGVTEEDEAPIRPRLPPGANINDFSNTGATAGVPPANEKDLGNGFTLTTTNYNGQNYPAVLDTQSKTYWIEKPAGSGTQYGMASYLRIVNGKADGKQPGDQTVDAMNAAGWKAASTSSPSPSPEPSANAPFVPRDYQTKEPLTQGTDGKWRNSKGEERDSLHGGPVAAQGTAQFRSLNIPTPESVDRMRGNVKIRKQGVAENKLPKPYKKWAS